MATRTEVYQSDTTALTVTRHEGKPYHTLSLVRIVPEVGRTSTSITLWDEDLPEIRRALIKALD